MRDLSFYFDEAVEKEYIAESICLDCDSIFFDEGNGLCPKCQKRNVEVRTTYILKQRENVNEKG